MITKLRMIGAMKSNNANGIEPINVLINPNVNPTIVLKMVIGAVKMTEPIVLKTMLLNNLIGSVNNLPPNNSGSPKPIAGNAIGAIASAGKANKAGKITGCANKATTGKDARTAPVATGANNNPGTNKAGANRSPGNPNSNGANPRPPSGDAALVAAVVAAVVAALP